MQIKLEIVNQQYNVDLPEERARMMQDLERIGFFNVPGFDRHRDTLASVAPGRDRVIDFFTDVRMYSQAILHNRRVH